MKKIILVGVLLSLMLFTTGCLVYGKGEQVGYVSAVDNEFFWDYVFFKPSLQSTQEDNYLVAKNSELSEQIKSEMEKGSKVKIHYRKHLITASGNSNDDEIVGLEVLKNDNR